MGRFEDTKMFFQNQLTYTDAQALSVETAPKMKWLEDPSTCRPCTNSCTANTKTNLCCMRKIMPYKTIEKVKENGNCNKAFLGLVIYITDVKTLASAGS